MHYATTVHHHIPMWREIINELFSVDDSAKYHSQYTIHEGKKTQRRDHGFFEAVRHVQRIPPLLMDLEVYFSLTCFGLAEHLLSLVLLPVKAVFYPKGMTLRDNVALAMIVCCLCVYWSCSAATTQLYSYLYHAVRRTSFIKLVIIFSMLDVLDKTLSSFSYDTLEVSYACVERYYEEYKEKKAKSNEFQKKNTVELQEGHLCEASNAFALPVLGGSGGSSTPSTSTNPTMVSSGDGGARIWPTEILREESPLHALEKRTAVSFFLLIWTAGTAMISTALHSLSLLLVAVTLNVAVNADDHSFVALLVSNNFNELKSSIFKKYTPESLHSVCVVDAIERLQYVLLFLVIILQHVSEKFDERAIADGLSILVVEVFIDFAKLLFCCRFNGIPVTIFRSYTELSLLDLASEKVLWKLPVLGVHVVRPVEGVPLTVSPPVGTTDAPSAALLLPSFGFAPKNVRRAGFNAVAYAALMLWCFLRVVGHLMGASVVVLVLSGGVLALTKLLLSALVTGISTRYVLRDLIDVSYNKLLRRPSPSAKDKPHSVHSSLARFYSALRPSDTAKMPMNHSNNEQQEEAHPQGFFIQLTPLLCALLKVNRFDLQAGKKK